MSHAFCRTLLRHTMADVRKVTTADERKGAWAYRYSNFAGAAEFHGPDGFLWNGTADCLWEARANGWAAYLETVK